MSGQRCQPTVDTARLCFNADAPVHRPRCTLTATIRIGNVWLCASCNTARSSLGKGQAPIPLPPGPAVDVLRWVTTANQQTKTAEATLAAAVTRARHAGASWSAIGAHLGITRQGAQQRFTPAPTHKTDKRRDS